MSRLLLENSNKPVELTPKTSGKVLVLEQNQNRLFIIWETPKKGEDIQGQVSKITELGDINLLTHRVLFRKITKGIDKKDFVIAQQELRIKQLEARVEQLEPRKRRKMKTSLNSRFAGIKAIKKAQVKARDH